jgi:hypothetical protein
MSKSGVRFLSWACCLCARFFAGKIQGCYAGNVCASSEEPQFSFPVDRPDHITIRRPVKPDSAYRPGASEVGRQRHGAGKDHVFCASAGAFDKSGGGRVHRPLGPTAHHDRG